MSDYRLVGAVGFAYLCLYAAVRLPLRGNPRWDLSYGLYVYHWPVHLLLALAGATALGEWAFAALGITLALGLAVLSWVFVEAPALRHKDAAWVDRRTSREPARA
jgi:peptidoglycan/LPS O-acetylase OafA/YrhL